MSNLYINIRNERESVMSAIAEEPNEELPARETLVNRGKVD